MPSFTCRDIKTSVASSKALQAVSAKRSAQLGLQQPSENDEGFIQGCERQLVQVCAIDVTCDG